MTTTFYNNNFYGSAYIALKMFEIWTQIDAVKMVKIWKKYLKIRDEKKIYIPLIYFNFIRQFKETAKFTKKCLNVPTPS